MINAVQAVVDGSFTGGIHVGTLANGVFILAPFHQSDSLVSAQVKADLEEIKASIISGDIRILPWSAALAFLHRIDPGAQRGQALANLYDCAFRVFDAILLGVNIAGIGCHIFLQPADGIARLMLEGGG